MRRFVFVILIVLASTAAGPEARATSEGLAIRQKINVSGMQRPDREQTLYYTPAVRITDDVRTTSIIDLDRRTVTFIDKQAKTYSVTTFEELAARDDRHDDRVRELPPKVRDMVESGDPVKITPTGRTLEVAGQETREYKVESRGMDGSVWIAEDLDIGDRAQEWLRVSDLFGGTLTPGGKLDRALAERKGVVLRRQIRIDPLPLVVVEALEVKREVPPSSLRRVPSGFTQVSSDEMHRSRRPTLGPRTPLPTPVLTPRR